MPSFSCWQGSAGDTDDLIAALTSLRLETMNGEPFERIFALTEKGAQTLNVTAANELFAAYLLQIERVIEAVDRTP